MGFGFDGESFGVWGGEFKDSVLWFILETRIYGLEATGEQVEVIGWSRLRFKGLGFIVEVIGWSRLRFQGLGFIVEVFGWSRLRFQGLGFIVEVIGWSRLRFQGLGFNVEGFVRNCSLRLGHGVYG